MNMETAQATELNNEGVYHLYHGHDELALRCFSESLKIFKALQLWRTKTNATETETLPVQSKHGNGIQFIDVLAFDARCQGHAESLETYLVRGAISFERSAAPVPGHNDAATISIQTASVVWNMALGHHLQASKSSDQFDITKASKMYEVLLMCVTSLREQIPSTFALMFQMCAVNNLANLYQRLGRHASSRKAIQHTFRLLNVAKFEMVEMLGHRTVRGILGNAVANDVSLSTKSAAAA